MNNKASFSAIVGIALIVLVASIGFVYYSNGISQKAMLEQQDALELGQHWTNVRFLLDKATAEAVFDSVQNKQNCNSLNDFNQKLENYFDKVINTTNNSISCNYSNLSISSQNVSEIKVSFSLNCYKQNSVSISQTLNFNKKLEKTSSLSKCQVWDNQGNFMEISE